MQSATVQELQIVLNRNENAGGFGFSLLGKPGLPPIIYNILEDSPAAENGQVEVGDVILKVNETDVNRFTTKEVLKCLRLSSDPVTLKINRDPKIKATICKYLVSSSTSDNCTSTKSAFGGGGGTVNSLRTNGNCIPNSEQTTNEFLSAINNNNNSSHNNNYNNHQAYDNNELSSNRYHHQQQQQLHYNSREQPTSIETISNLKCNSIRGGDTVSEEEARNAAERIMTNNKCRLAQPAEQQKQQHQQQPTPAVAKQQPKFEAFMMTGEHILNISRMPQSTRIVPRKQKKMDGSRYHNSHTHHLRHQQQQQQFSSLPNSPNELELSLKSHLSRTAPEDSCPNATTETSHPKTATCDDNSNNNSSATATTTTAPSGSTNTLPVDEEPVKPPPPQQHSFEEAEEITTMTTTMSTRSYTGSCSSGSEMNSFVRNSRSEDQLHVRLKRDKSQLVHHNTEDDDGDDDDDDDDITSSLNTLLDTRADIVDSDNSDRIVWTYNAPMTAEQQRLLLASQRSTTANTQSNSMRSHNTNSSPTSSSPSPLHSVSPQSPTSVSSSVMSSSQSGSRRQSSSNHANSNNHQLQQQQQPQQQQQMFSSCAGGDYSVSEAISNMSSPDYHDDDMISMAIRDCDLMMAISDHSDSDSTLLVSEPRQKKRGASKSGGSRPSDHHRVVIQVKGPEKGSSGVSGAASGDKCRGEGAMKSRNDTTAYLLNNDKDGSDPYHDADDESNGKNGSSSSPQSSEDESDLDSLHSFHYSPKAVDLPSAERLAKRLITLDGFKKSDVSRHLSKNNDFSRAVAEEYLKYFKFERDTLDLALRKFLKQFSLTGETQERERVLVHFSKRYLDCNPGSFNSQDAVHTLTCAIMLLNTDLHGQNIGRKMTCGEFIENLAGLNECDNFPRDILKHLYHAIKNYPLQWAFDDDVKEGGANTQIVTGKITDSLQVSITNNPYKLDGGSMATSSCVDYKKGYVMRKCCYEANAKRTPFHKRSWKMFYCTLRNMALYLHKDDQMGDNVHNVIRIHHSYATKATDYKKKLFVFRLQTADQAEYLFQTSDSKEWQSWIDTINFVSASLSMPALEGGVGSQKKFQRPFLPCGQTKLNQHDQLRDHEERVLRLELELEEHRTSPPDRHSKSLIVQNYKEKELYLCFEIKRYETYASLLHANLSQSPSNQLAHVSLAETSIGELEEVATPTTPINFNAPSNVDEDMNGEGNLVPHLSMDMPRHPSPSVINRYSYKEAIYCRNMLNNNNDTEHLA